MSETPLRRPERQSPGRGSCFSMALALLFWGSVILASLVLLPGVFPQVLIGGALVCAFVFGFHYFVWGRWMKKLLEEARADEDE